MCVIWSLQEAWNYWRNKFQLENSNLTPDIKRRSKQKALFSTWVGVGRVMFQIVSLYHFVMPQAAQAHYLWVRASEVIWSEYTRIISVLSNAK